MMKLPFMLLFLHNLTFMHDDNGLKHHMKLGLTAVNCCRLNILSCVWVCVQEELVYLSRLIFKDPQIENKHLKEICGNLLNLSFIL